MPDVAGQVVIRPSQAEFVDQKSPSKCTETNSSTSTLGGQRNNGNGVGCTATGPTCSPAGLTASPRVSQNKSKPKMVKPKKPEIGVWKTVESKSRHKHEKKKAKPNNKFPAKSSKQKDIKHASRNKNSK